MDPFISKAVRRPQPGTLKYVIREAVRAATHAEKSLPWSAESITRGIIVKNRQLVEVWMFEKLTVLVRAELRARPDPNQLFLPGFKDLSRRLPLEDGFVRLGEATIMDLRNAARTIQEQNRRKVAPMAARVYELIELMEPYSKKHHGLTVAQFYAMMRARRESADAAPTNTSPAVQAATSSA